MSTIMYTQDYSNQTIIIVIKYGEEYYNKDHNIFSAVILKYTNKYYNIFSLKIFYKNIFKIFLKIFYIL